MSNHLIPLPPGSTINIGRKLSCNVVVDSNLVSNLHCKLTITSDPPFKATLLDCSRNGTWIQRASEVNGTSASTSTKKSSSAQKAEKLKNGGDVKELHDGDSILLLAPSHKMTSSYRYKLIRGDDGKLLLEKLSSNGTSDATTASKRKKSEAEGARMTPTKKRKMESPDGADGGAAAVKVSKSATGKPNAHTVLTKEEENEMGRCPTCRKLFHISVLPIHCPICQECPHELCEDTTTTTTMEECVFCSKIFLTGDLAAHHEVCEGETVKRSLEQIGECPKCSVILPINELIEHSAKCRAPAKPIHLAGTIQSSSSEPCEEMEVDGAKMLISAARDGPGVGPAAGPAAGLSTTLELEQCAFCLQDFPVCDMPDHYSQCTTKSKSGVMEHCVHCLALFPLDELIQHSALCKQRGGEGGAREGSQGDPLERCMHCFKDFPLSQMVVHSNMCMGKGASRFKNFIPSVHDLEPMDFLTTAQKKAVDYVTEKSKRDSEAVYFELAKRVGGLGYSEDDLKTTLQWIRTDAPIIIHLNLDRCLRYLVKDTHYRNLFETGTGGGGDNKRSRTTWENRIFNHLYGGGDVKPFDRVKYGVLNIVGDPRGVECCRGYGDSFIQLKKVRLRTTFASADTCRVNVKLSCCEHYGNVLFEYNDMELKAILDVATRRKSFLRSSIISEYKEVQIHGPVSLSENVDCIVVNERHKSCRATVEMLEEFVKQNNCNLIWMEPTKSIDYPCFK